MSPFGFIIDGLGDTEDIIEEKSGDRWVFANRDNQNEILEVWNLDEYGDVSTEWGYR